MTDSKPAPPVAPVKPKTFTQLGRTRTDDYAWLKDDNWQEILRDPGLLRGDIRTYLEAENAYGEAVLAPTKALQARLYEEMKGRIKEDDNSVPGADGPYEYYSRYEIGAQHPITARRPRNEAAFPAPIPSVEATRAVEEVLLDEEELSRGHDYYETGGSSHSNDHLLFAWSEDTQGSEYYTIYVKVIATGELLGSAIESSTGDFGFSPCSNYLFWTWRDENGRPSKVYRRPARGGEDVLIYEELDPGFFLGLSVLSDESYIEIGIGNQETSESWLIPASDPTATPVCVEPRTEGVLYDIDHWNDRFIIRTNADGAIDFKLMRSDAATPSRDSWLDFIPHRTGIYITGVSAYKHHLVRSERENANLRIVITRFDDLSEHSIDVAEEAYALGSYGGYEYDTAILRFGYTSPTTPSQTFDYDMNTRQRVLRKTQEIPSGHNPDNYVAKRLYATAPDGEQVPITVLMRKDTPLDGTAPLFLYGYGSYGASMDPSFSISRLSLVDRGFIYATAHVRGGSEKGFGWFLAARKFSKINTFTDFIACAEHLIANSYTTKGKIVAYGGSAGGLLMGAVANMRPDLWAGIIGAVPFIDVLNTMSDLSLPLTPPEWPEWGNPLEDAAAYDYIASYSPYDNIVSQPYPAVLATGGLSDPRVTYWEPTKWVAKLRRYTTSDAPILLKMNMEAGHGGASGRFEYLKEIAFEYAFALWVTGKAGV
jgi:oligopeptidase B